MRCDVRDIEQMIVMPVADKNRQRAIRRSWKQSLDYRRIWCYSRSTLQPLESIGPSSGQVRVAEERRGEESVISVLEKNPGSTQVSDRDYLAGITALCRRATDSVRCRDNLMPDDVWTPAARDSEQCARQNPEVESGGASQGCLC